MGTNAVRRGTTADTVSANVKRLRNDANLGLRGLAKKLGDIGRPLTHSAIDQIEKGDRRVDVDDLMALAVALDVSPITLLMPAGVESDTAVTASGTGEVSAETLWNWCNASYPLRGPVLAFYGRALPAWEQEPLEPIIERPASRRGHRGNR